MACHDEDFQCDFCAEKGAVWIKFCTLCGMDYCNRCKITHDAQHEFVAEVYRGGRAPADSPEVHQQ